MGCGYIIAEDRTWIGRETLTELAGHLSLIGDLPPASRLFAIDEPLAEAQLLCSAAMAGEKPPTGEFLVVSRRMHEALCLAVQPLAEAADRYDEEIAAGECPEDAVYQYEFRLEQYLAARTVLGGKPYG